jgi:hypothetical protein
VRVPNLTPERKGAFLGTAFFKLPRNVEVALSVTECRAGMFLLMRCMAVMHFWDGDF